MLSEENENNMIYKTRCKIKYPHDFKDYPCKKCNGIILEVVWEKIKRLFI